MRFTLYVANSVNRDNIRGASVAFISKATGDEFQGHTESGGIFTFLGVSFDADGVLTIVKEGFVTFQDTDFSFGTSESGFYVGVYLNPELVVSDFFLSNLTIPPQSHYYNDCEFQDTEDKRVSLTWGPYYVDLNLAVLQINSQNNQVECIVTSFNGLCGDVQYGLDIKVS